MTNSNLFSLEGKVFHQLNQFDFHKDYKIQIGETKFNFTKAQLAFLSLKTHQHFKYNQILKILKKF
jgi:hypothetical protein